MDSDGTLLGLGHHLRLLLQSADDTVNGIEEVLLAHLLAVVTGCDERCLVTYVGNVGTRESRGLTGQELYVNALVEFEGLQVYLEDLCTLVEVGQIDMNLTVEASSTQQGRVEHVGTVGGCQGDDTAVRAETVHLGQQGVQRVLALVVAAHGRVLRTGTAHGVNLVDEDDTRCLLLGLLEQVTHTAGTHAYEHLHEVGTRHREEWHTSLAGYGLCHQRFTRSRRTYEQCALGNLSAQFGVFLRVLQEIHNLLHLLLGTRLSGHILESDLQVAAVLVHLCTALTYGEDASAHARTATHAAHDEDPHGHNDENRQDVV